MRWAAVVILTVVLLSGCRRQEEDIEALSREAVEDEVTAVLDSLERAANAPRTDTIPVVTAAPSADDQPPDNVSSVSTSVPSAGGEPEPAPISTPSIVVAAESLKTAAVEPGKVGWAIQIGTYAEHAAAEAAAETYRQAGFPVFVRRAEKDGKTFYRLRIGVYDSREEAQKVGEELKSRYGLDYWIAFSQ